MVTQIRSGGAGIPRTTDSNGNQAGSIVVQDRPTPPQLKRYQEDITIAQATASSTGAKLSIDVSGYSSALMSVDKAGVLNGDTVSCTAYLDDAKAIETHGIGWTKASYNGTSASRNVLQAITPGLFYLDLKGIKFLRLWKITGGATADVELNMVYTGQ